MGCSGTPRLRSAFMRAHVAGRACLHGRALRWLAPEHGDTLIEVMVAAIMVALVAGATLTGYAQVAHMSSTQRHRVEADSLAELDQARLRGLTISQLAGAQGNRAVSETVDGEIYTITSRSQYVSGTTAAMSCTT